MKTFSVGIFLDILTKKQKEWEDNLQFVAGLTNVEHLELLLEYIPQSNREIIFFNRLAKQYRLIIHAPSLDLTLLSPHQEIVQVSLEKLRQAYQFAISINAELFTIHAGQMPKFWSEATTLKKLKDSVRKIQKSKKLPVCIENLVEKWSIQIAYPSTVNHYQHVAEFSDLTLDIGHFIKSGTNPLPVLKKFSNKIQNIHLHDAGKESAHLPLGKGILNITNFLKILEEIGYDKFITIELVGKEEIRTSWNILQRLIQ